MSVQVPHTLRKNLLNCVNGCGFCDQFVEVGCPSQSDVLRLGVSRAGTNVRLEETLLTTGFSNKFSGFVAIHLRHAVVDYNQTVGLSFDS